MQDPLLSQHYLKNHSDNLGVCLLRMAAAAQEGRQHEFMRAMLVLKMGCQQWLENYGGDTSGFIYKSVKDGRNRLDPADNTRCLEITFPLVAGWFPISSWSSTGILCQIKAMWKVQG